MIISPTQVWAQEKKDKKEKKEAEKHEQLIEQYAAQRDVHVQERQIDMMSKALQKEGVYIVTDNGPVPPPPPQWSSYGSENSFNLSMQKNYNGESTVKNTSFNVLAEQKKLSIYVTGACKEGSISITFTSPDGKIFNGFAIDDSANMSWKQTLSIEEKYQGEWKIKIKADKTNGFYKLDIKIF